MCSPFCNMVTELRRVSVGEYGPTRVALIEIWSINWLMVY